MFRTLISINVMTSCLYKNNKNLRVRIASQLFFHEDTFTLFSIYNNNVE